MTGKTGKKDVYLPTVIPIVEPTQRWIRVKFGNKIIANSKNALLVRHYGEGLLPTYYFPRSDVDQDILKPSSPDLNHSSRMRFWSVESNEKSVENGAWAYVDPPRGLDSLHGYVSFQWDAMDAWYEEEEEVFVHARDPYKRIDVLESSRNIRVEINGVCIAESSRPFLLFETGLPVRYYLSADDIRFDLLIKSEFRSRCPYKGVAEYWSITTDGETLENVLWSYSDPLPEIPKIRELISFYNEILDIYVDGELQDTPDTSSRERPC